MMAAVLVRPASAQLLDRYFPAFTYGVGGPNPENVQLLRPDSYNFPGVRVGSFIIRPRVQESVGYDSNVDGVQNGRGSAAIVTDASLSAESDWGRNSVRANLTVDDQRYPDSPLENQTNWTAGVGGTYEIGRDQFSGSYTHLNLYETSRDLASVAVVQPLGFQIDDFEFSYKTNTRGRLSFVPNGDVLLYRFDNMPVPGTTVSEEYQNRNVYEGGLTTLFELAPERNLVLVTRGTHIQYVTLVDDIPNRDSNGGTILAGIDYRANGAFRYRALIGYQVRAYVNAQFKTISAPIAEASVSWSPTRLTRLTATLRRGIEDAADTTIGGYVFTGGRIDLDHELKRDVFLNAYVQAENANFGSASSVPPAFAFLQSSGSQTIVNTGASVTWAINRHLRAGLSYGFTERFATAPSRYVENVFLLSMAAGL